MNKEPEAPGQQLDMKKRNKKLRPARPPGIMSASGVAEALRSKDLEKAVDSIENAYLVSSRFSIKDLSSRVLKAAKNFTGSRYGFAAYLDPHTGRMTDPALRRTAYQGRPSNGEPRVVKKFGGLWGWVLENKKPLLTNAASSDPRSNAPFRKNIKAGKFMATPALFNKKLAGIITLANPWRDYGASDLAAVERLARVYAIIIQRHLAEDKLKESEGTYRSIIEASQDTIATINIEGRFTYMSRQAENYGYAPHEMVGRHVLEFVHPDDRYLLRQALARTLKTGRTLPLLHFRIKKKDGSYFYAEQKSGVIMKDGKPFTISCIVRDITKRRELDSALSQLTRCFLKFGPDPDKNIEIITLTAGEIFKDACVLYNRIEGSLLRTVSDWQAPPDMPRLDKAKGHICFDLILTAKDKVFIVRDLDKSRYAASDPNVRKYKLKTYIGYPVRVAGKKIGSLCAVFKTATEATATEIEVMSILAKALGIEEKRRQAESQLRENEETLRKIFDSAQDAIFIKDLNGRYVKTNSFCAALFGLTPRQMEGKSDYDLMPAELARNLSDKDQSVVRNGGSLVSDSEILTAKGEIRTFNSVKTQLCASGGLATGVLGVSRDVTELKKLQTQLVEARAAEVVSKITEPVAHDFNNILAAINGYAALILETLKAGDPVRPEITHILNAIKRAAAITERLQPYDSRTGKKS
ncbi:MAG: hypothetical protein A2218_04660 [Elusimicrobia bacterium RIFOXYA2_FULL_53_38]|nr:MAG: hypothetical protein A2218_04660 [Elusimicrobia bacterium RIFOXYA2_FULL_53_38]